MKNFLAINLLSLGAPMLLMGDEVRRTQRGNNNAYCQDNEISWFDWSRVEPEADLRRFVRELIGLRSLRESVQSEHHLTLAELTELSQIELHGVRIGEPDFGHESRSLAVSASTLSGTQLMYYALNAYWENLEFELPELPTWATSGWRRIVDTSLASPDDVAHPAVAPAVSAPTYVVGPRSALALLAFASE